MDAFEFYHHLPAGFAARQRQPHVALQFAAGGAFAAQFVQTAHAPFVAGAPRFDAFANPDFFLGEEFVELFCRAPFGGEFLVAAGAVFGVTAGIAGKLATVERDDAGGDAVEKGAVVGDDDERAAKIAHQLFQPEDAVNVQMVGGFVEQQHVGIAHQCAGERDALERAAGQCRQRCLCIQPKLVNQGFGALLQAPGIGGLNLLLQVGKMLHRCFVGVLRQRQHGGVIVLQQPRRFAQRAGNGVENVAFQRKIGFLRHVGDDAGGIGAHAAVIERRLPRQYAQQAGFAAAVATNEGDALASVQLKMHVVQ